MSSNYWNREMICITLECHSKATYRSRGSISNTFVKYIPDVALTSTPTTPILSLSLRYTNYTRPRYNRGHPCSAGVSLSSYSVVPTRSPSRNSFPLHSSLHRVQLPRIRLSSLFHHLAGNSSLPSHCPHHYPPFTPTRPLVIGLVESSSQPSSQPASQQSKSADGKQLLPRLLKRETVQASGFLYFSADSLFLTVPPFICHCDIKLFPYSRWRRRPAADTFDITKTFTRRWFFHLCFELQLFSYLYAFITVTVDTPSEDWGILKKKGTIGRINYYRTNPDKSDSFCGVVICRNYITVWNMWASEGSLIKNEKQDLRTRE